MDEARSAVTRDEAVTAVAKAAKSSGVCWLRPVGAEPGTPWRLVWHTWYDGALLVLSDADQPLEPVVAAGRVEVVMRARTGDVRGPTWTGEVEVVGADDPRWAVHAQALLAARLNLPDLDAALEGWRRTARVLRITTLKR
jgi:hypothetical protein